MAMWETDDEVSSPVAASLPTPSDTPYQTPSRRSSRASRRSRRSGTPPATSSSPPPMPTEKSAKRSSKVMNADEPISAFDPRRFTPTLHANLVSEILNLRRDQEDKLKIIERLEVALHSTKQEQETEQATLHTTSKENRSLKRQLALLEGGTSSALGELAKERDEAVDAIVDTKKRLEAAQKKVRSHEEDSQRVHEQWAKERDEWEEEKLKYERRLHVADTRMKTVLEEVANLQDAQLTRHNHPETDAEEASKDNDAASVRTNSLTNSIRFSAIPTEAPGASLADELNFDSDGYQTDADGRESIAGRESVLSNHHHNRQFSRDSVMSLKKTHRRNMSSESQMRPGSVARGRMLMNQNVLDRLEGGIREDDETPPPPKPEYKNAGVQFSPPPSPKIVAVKPATPEPVIKIEKPIEVDSPPRADTEIEANQRRKRVHIHKPVPFELPTTPSKLMVSAASQTVEAPLSPPTTPKLQQEELFTVMRTPMSTVATQTDKQQEQEPSPKQSDNAPLLIPSISVHPPTSRPQTPKEHRLPQYVKDFGCQVSLIQDRPTTSTSTAVQTDEIRVDKRLDRLPPHLHPSAISSRPTSPSAPTAASGADDGNNFSPVPGNLPPRNPRRLTSKRSFTTESPSSPPASPSAVETVAKDAYPGNNDDGPLSNQKAPVRRPHRISSLFAGFDGASSDEGDELLDGDLSDNEFKTALSAPKPKSPSYRHKSRGSAATSSTMDTMPSIPRHGRSTLKHIGTTEVYSSYNLAEDRDTVGRMPAVARPGEKAMNSSTRAGAMRKSALIQSGITSHGRSRSPSLGEHHDPPFPIPTRASSRKPPFTSSAPSDGQRSPIYGNEGLQRRNSRARSNSIRKVRSAAAIPRTARNRRRGSSPPPLSPTEQAPESPGLPPLPKNDITTPQKSRGYGTGRYRGHRSQPSTTTANTDNTNIGSVASGPQASGVVDAIAQTMVGEWMYKYVRRRKSFGMADTKADETSNDRHKRWVWLAPYERAILWSSKQPSSGSALMGKSGRKLSIQSVLDVKDDNPAPKGASPLFNRSILILTPQRALKFTATSSERHYLWLTSLSFLAHSTQAVPEILSPVPPQTLLKPTSAPAYEAPTTRTKKPTIRDSIRLAKVKHPALIKPEPLPVASEELEDELAFKPESLSTLNHARDLSMEVAEPPFIPRYHERSSERVHERANQVVLHGRKRSNTGPGSYHTATDSIAGNSVATAENSDMYAVGSSTGHAPSTWGMSTNGSVRTSEASSRPGNNFFEAIGTVRMEAFISPLAFPRVQEYPEEQDDMRYRARRRSKEVRRRRSRSRHRDSFNSRTTRGTDEWHAASSTRGKEEYFRDDPFKGF
ncbi:nuclear migration protein [Apiospora sp. TS-2023a]